MPNASKAIKTMHNVLF